MEPVLIVSLILNVVLVALRLIAPRTENKFDDAVLDVLEDKQKAPAADVQKS